MSSTVVLTQAAITQLIKKCQAEPGVVGVTLYLKTMGCSGLAYELDYVTEPLPKAYQQEINNHNKYKLYVPEEDLDKILGTTIDYQQQGINFKFIYTNPNATGECGCGESFSLKSTNE